MSSTAPTAGLAGHRKGRVPRSVREQQLLDISQELFLTLGFDATSIEEICRRADVSRPLVYDLVGNKAAIFLACVRRARATLEVAISEAVDGVSDPRDQLFLGAEAYLRILEEDPRRGELLFGKTSVLGELGPKLDAERAKTVALIVGQLRAFDPDADGDRVAAYAHLISGAVEQLGRWWAKHPRLPRETIAGYLADFAWNGARGLGG